MRIRILALGLLLGCSAGDLTLPGSAQPATLRPVAGDDQRAQAGDVLEQPLVVEVLDAGNRPVSGTTVEFGFLGVLPGAGLDPAAVSTDEAGRAAAVVRLGAVSGEQVIVARVAGSVSPDLAARFTALAVGRSGGGDDDRGKRKKEGGNEDNDDD